MWCPRCRQDVPAIAAPFDQALCCARCRHLLSNLSENGTPPGATTDKVVAEKPVKSPTSALEELELLTAEQQVELDSILSRAEWLLGIPTGPAASSKSVRGKSGFHPPHQRLEGHHSIRRPAIAAPPRASRIIVASWSALAVALTGFVCGGILLAWSLISNRPELWNVGETVTLASQVGLLIGLILQLERLGHDRHQTVDRLTILDERVESLRSGGGLWSQGSGSRTDPPDGLPSENLLADLKNQLDHLANRLGEKRSA